MNTPYGNSITAAEHTIAMMFALARQIPMADRSTQAGKWEKSRVMGVELSGKVLGIVGCGNIGAIVADRAHGLRMKVIAFDPFLSPERAVDLGVERVAFEELLSRADFITLHTPLTEATTNIIDAAAIARMKRGVRLINCARGGLVAEADLAAALDSGQVAGAAFDVFVEEPARDNALFGHANFIATPHLGAATAEAQENVALQIAEQMADFLLTGAVSNAVNMPYLTAGGAAGLRPYLTLAEQLGRHMLFVRNYDKPGFIGALGHTLGAAQINIATFHLGRTAAGEDAIALVEVDQPMSAELIEAVRRLPNVIQAKAMRF